MLKDMIFILNPNPRSLSFQESWSFNTSKHILEVEISLRWVSGAPKDMSEHFNVVMALGEGNI